MRDAPTPAGEPADNLPDGRRMSAVEAQILAMRSQAVAIAQMANAFAVQCDSLLLATGILGGLGASRPDAGARPASPGEGKRHPTFGHREATAPDPDALKDRIANNDPSSRSE